MVNRALVIYAFDLCALGIGIGLGLLLLPTP